MTRPAIQIQDCTFDFHDHRVIDCISLEVPYGCIFGLLGPHGAGKTTIIRLLLGIEKPSAGSLQVLGFDPLTQAKRIRAQTGVLLADDGLYEHLSALENLAFFGRIWRMPRGEIRARSRQLLKQLNLWQHRHELIGAWSRGKRKKLAVARTLLHHPQILLLDEPTADLDAHSAMEIQRLLKSVAMEESMTIFLASANLQEIERLCSHAAVLQKGQVLAAGALDDLRVHPGGLRFAFFGKGFNLACLEILRTHPGVLGAQIRGDTLSVDLSSHDRDPAPLVDLLQQAGAEVNAVQGYSANLKEFFPAVLQEEPTC